MNRMFPLVIMALAALCAPTFVTESQCFGTVSKGSIEGSVKLPTSGANFAANSLLGIDLHQQNAN